MFDAIKLRLSVWFQAIYVMTEDKKGILAMKLHRHPGICCNAAWRITHKLVQVMIERDRGHSLARVWPRQCGAHSLCQKLLVTIDSEGTSDQKPKCSHVSAIRTCCVTLHISDGSKFPPYRNGVSAFFLSNMCRPAPSSSESLSRTEDLLQRSTRRVFRIPRPRFYQRVR